MEKYNALDNRWEKLIHKFDTESDAIEFYNNNSNPFNDDPTKNTPVYRIIQIKTIEKKILENTRQMRWEKSHVNMLRKTGRIR